MIVWDPGEQRMRERRQGWWNEETWQFWLVGAVVVGYVLCGVSQ